MSYTLDSVSASLRAMLAALGAGMPHVTEEAIGRIAGQVERDLAETATRSAIAALLAGVVTRFDFEVAADKDVGNLVHRVLQQRYVGALSSRHDITMERGISLHVTGPGVLRATGQPTVPLRVLARPELDPDAFWRILRFALNGAKFHRASWLRADLVDRDTDPFASIWEIKPIRSAVGGVWQEAFYRISFNILRAILLEQPEYALSPLTPPLCSGSGFGPPHTLSAILVNAPLGSLLQGPGGGGASAPASAVAVPFEFSQLPGLVMYVVLTVPMKKLREAVERMMRRVLRDLGERAQELLSKLATLADFLIKALLVLVCVVVAVAVAILLGPEALAASAVAAVLLVLFPRDSEAASSPDIASTIRFRSPEQFGVSPRDAAAVRKELRHASLASRFDSASGSLSLVFAKAPAPASSPAAPGTVNCGGVIVSGLSARATAALLTVHRNMMQKVMANVAASLAQLDQSLGPDPEVA